MRTCVGKYSCILSRILAITTLIPLNFDCPWMDAKVQPLVRRIQYSMTSPDTLTRHLQETALEKGADLFGVAASDCFLNPHYTGNKPQDVMESARSVIVIGVAVPSGSIDHLPRGRAEYTNTLMAGTATLRVIAFHLAREIEKKGYSATIVPTEGSEFGYWYADRETLMADISIKYAAFCAGLGSYGINHLLITDAYGPRVRMTAIITDAPLDKSGNSFRPLLYEGCRDCMKCVEACPVTAFTADGMIDRHRCADYMFQTLGGLRCGLCVRACPAGRRG
ncbi:MAG TPA: epoxyqueuosine reductase [Methanoregulaceae archaeon]|nr:epoxyqueuosine reductase [Methanoregulaceae archaeon]